MQKRCTQRRTAGHATWSFKALKCNRHLAHKHIVRAWGEEPLHNGDPSRWTPKLDALAPEAADPASALRCVLDVVRERNLDGMLEFCPDELIDRLVAHRKEAG